MIARRAALALVFAAIATPAGAQHAAFRVKGRVVTERGEPVANADVRLEAFFGYAAGTFAGQRLLSTTTNARGEWSVGALQPGVWEFDVFAPGYVPETVILPIRILTTVSMGTSGMSLLWDLVLKPDKSPDGDRGTMLGSALEQARGGKIDAARVFLQTVPENADADYLAAAGRVAMVARDTALAKTLFQRALERDPSSYRAALGLASSFLVLRDFDNASRAPGRTTRTRSSS